MDPSSTGDTRPRGALSNSRLSANRKWPEAPGLRGVQGTGKTEFEIRYSLTSCDVSAVLA
jgi:hypothetical protein